MSPAETRRPVRCADVRRALQGRLHATAPERAASWLLVEHSRPWPSLDLPSDRPPAAASVLARVADVAIRPQLIRRVADRRTGASTGAVDAADVPALAEALTSGRVLRRLLRGRAGLPFPVQAADFFLRDRLDVDTVEAIRPVACTTSAGGDVGVELLAGEQRWCVRVRASRCTDARLTSCAGQGTADRPVSFELLSAVRQA